MNKPADPLAPLEKAIGSNNFYEIQNQFTQLSENENLDINQLQRAGSLANGIRRHEIALHFFDKMIAREPKNLAALFQAGDACTNIGNLGLAEQYYFRGLKIDDQYAPCLAGLGRVYLSNHMSEKAVDILEIAAHIQKDDVNIHINLARGLTELAEYDRALETLKKVEAQSGKSPYFMMAMGNIYAELGEMENARKYYKRGFKVDPHHGRAYVNYARVTKFKEEDLKEIQNIEKILDNNLTSDVEEPIRFSLGKMYDDAKQYEKAFKHYAQANAIGKKPILDDLNILVRMRKRLSKPKYQKRLAKHANPSDMPIFVVGMPRSGTTLLTQLLSRHSKIGSAGERMDVPLIEKALMDNYRIRSFDNLRPLNFIDEDSLGEKANAYIEMLGSLAKGKPLMVDKLPANHMQLALIHALFPNAHVIHITRHPLDTCLSCFFQDFEHLPWSNDLKTIGEVYDRYRIMMDFWSKNLPLQHFTEVSYEQLVDDQENELRRLIEFCGLEWEEQCLGGDKQTDTAVKTASLWQARQPIYKSSKQRWVHYAPYLKELANEIAPWLKEDKELLAEHGINIK